MKETSEGSGLYGKAGAIVSGALAIYGSKKIGEIVSQNEVSFKDYFEAFGSFFSIYLIPWLRAIKQMHKDERYRSESRKAWHDLKKRSRRSFWQRRMKWS